MSALPANSLPPLYDVAHVAAHLGKTPQWVRENAATFDGIKLGREWRFTADGIRAGLDQLRTDTRPHSPTAASVPVTPLTLESARRLRRRRP